jgi:hypothetical protein
MRLRSQLEVVPPAAYLYLFRLAVRGLPRSYPLFLDYWLLPIQPFRGAVSPRPSLHSLPVYTRCTPAGTLQVQQRHVHSEQVRRPDPC